MLRIKELRGKRTQEYTAQQLGLKQQTYRNYENGERQADYETLAKMAHYFGVSIEYMLGIDNSVWTTDDYANGVRETKKVEITADEEDVLDKYKEVDQLLGEKGKDLIIDFCDMLIKKLGE